MLVSRPYCQGWGAKADDPVAIMLSRIKLSFPAICQAILELDDEALSIDDLKAIGKQLPTKEEVRPILS